MTLIPERLAKIDSITLEAGSHDSPAEGMCIIEFADWLAGGEGSARSEFVSRAIRVFSITLNDNWGHADRQRLRPFGPRIVGTAGDGQDVARSFLALDWIVRTYAPAWLDAAGLSAEAESLRSLERVIDARTAEATISVSLKAAAKSRAAGDATRAIAWDAAETIARDAARDAAMAIARAAASAAVWEIAWDAARDAARAAAGDATRAIAWDAAETIARDAARDAATLTLSPTTEALKASALELLEAMIDPAKNETENTK